MRSQKPRSIIWPIIAFVLCLAGVVWSALASGWLDALVPMFLILTGAIILKTSLA